MADRSRLARKINSLALPLHKSYENLNYNFESNGELSLLHKIRGSQIPFKHILDVGANRGKRSVATAKLFDQAQIHSFEILPTTYELLLKNSKHFPNITSHQTGLSDVNEVLQASILSNTHSRALPIKFADFCLVASLFKLA